MTKNVLSIVLEKLAGLSQKAKTKIVIAGGIATSILARPRATFDIDGIISLKQRGLKYFLTLLRNNGFKFDQKQPIKYIQGMPFITFYYPKYKTYVDLFIAQSEFHNEIFKRAKKIKLEELNLYIISAEDLILNKLKAGRAKDIEDVRELILENKNKLNFKYLEKWAKQLNLEIFLKDELESLGIK